MIRRAKEKDIPKIGDLLEQVCLVHHNGRPDIFKVGTKYSDGEIAELLENNDRPILVSVDERDEVMGYCFCILEQHKDHSVLTDIKTLYIDDLCVDESSRGKGVGKAIYDVIRRYAKGRGCHAVTLNVWNFNEGAYQFYVNLGLVPRKTYMEDLLDAE